MKMKFARYALPAIALSLGFGNVAEAKTAPAKPAAKAHVVAKPAKPKPPVAKPHKETAKPAPVVSKGKPVKKAAPDVKAKAKPAVATSKHDVKPHAAPDKKVKKETPKDKAKPEKAKPATAQPVAKAKTPVKTAKTPAPKASVSKASPSKSPAVAKPAPAKTTPVKAAAPVAVKPAHTRVGLMMDMDSGQIIGGENGALNPDLRFNPASMTKVMTLYIAMSQLENGTLKRSDILQIPHETLISESNQKNLGDALLNEGNWAEGKPMHAILEARVEDILKAIIVSSSNNGCIALAKKISGNEKAFAKLMNETAQKMGLANSHFMNASGFPRAGEVKDHYVSARDLLTVMHKLAGLMKRVEAGNPGIFDGITGEKIDLHGKTKDGWISYKSKTHSKLIEDGEYHVPGITFLKTGYSKPAGWGTILTAKVEKENISYNVGYIVGGFDTQLDREQWLHNKMKAMPDLLPDATPRISDVKLDTTDDTVTGGESVQSATPAGSEFGGLAAIFGVLGAGAVAYGMRKKLLPEKKKPSMKSPFIEANSANYYYAAGSSNSLASGGISLSIRAPA